jgi:hypothetical protein
MMIEDVELDFTDAFERQHYGELQAPLTAVALAAAGVSPSLPGDLGVGNQQGAVGSGRKITTVSNASAAQRNIFALELRIVTTTLFRRWELALKEDGPKGRSGAPCKR